MGLLVLGEATFFSTLNTNNGYWRIEIEGVEIGKTAFTSHYGLYNFIPLLFRLHNAPGRLQPAMKVALSMIKWQFAFLNLDNIVIFCTTPEKHTDHFCKIHLLLYNGGVTLKLKKCNFFISKLDYIRQVICLRRFSIASHTTGAIRGLETTASLSELR